MYKLLVAGVGECYHGTSKAEAEGLYALHVSRSQSGKGQAGGRDITLLLDGAIIKQHKAGEAK
jgi:hypothetical protein